MNDTEKPAFERYREAAKRLKELAEHRPLIRQGFFAGVLDQLFLEVLHGPCFLVRVDFLNVFNRTVFGLSTGGDQYGSV